MLIKNKGVVLVAGMMILFVTSGCYKVATVVIDNTPAVTKTVSFSKDIVPILTKSCALSGCHNAGGHAPDLTSENAFNSLVVGGYTSKANPSSSKVYQWLTGKGAVLMPMGATNNPSNINGLVLAWITQGVKNN